MAEYTGYCMKCKEKGRVIKDAKVVDMGKGRKAAKGTCSVCGTNMYAILKKDAAKAA